MTEVKNISNSVSFKKIPHILFMGVSLILLLASTGRADVEGGEYEQSPISIPGNGEICKRCDEPASPNVYYSQLEEFFADFDQNKHSKNEIIKSVEILISQEVSDIAYYVGDILDSEGPEPYTEEVLKNKLEGLKVLANVFEIHFGSWGKEVVENSLAGNIKVCAFNEDGKVADITAYIGGEELSCRQMSIHDVFDLLANKQSSAKLHAIYEAPSIIAEKFVGKKMCTEDTVDSKIQDQQFCGILKSKRIREAFNEEKSLIYVGGRHQSYACKQVGLFFQRNQQTNRIEPQPDKSYLVDPNGTKLDLQDDQVKEIIKEIYRPRGALK